MNLKPNQIIPLFAGILFVSTFFIFSVLTPTGNPERNIQNNEQALSIVLDENAFLANQQNRVEFVERVDENWFVAIGLIDQEQVIYAGYCFIVNDQGGISTQTYTQETSIVTRINPVNCVGLSL